MGQWENFDVSGTIDAFSEGWEGRVHQTGHNRPHLESRRRPRLAGGGQTHVEADATPCRTRHAVLSWVSVGNSEWAKWHLQVFPRPG